MHEHITRPPVGVKFPKKVCSYHLLVRSCCLSKFACQSFAPLVFYFSFSEFGMGVSNFGVESI